jgi:cell division protein ZapA
MATIDVEIAARSYAVSCRDGDEPHLRQLAAVVDRKAKEAAAALGSMGESRQLLYASLLLADELKEARSGVPGAPLPEPQADPAVADALERLADRVERLAESLEAEARNP